MRLSMSGTGPPVLRSAMPLTSPPAQKAPPAPVSTTAPTSGSTSQASSVVASAWSMAGLSALRRSGLDIVRTATVPSTAAWRSSVPVSIRRELMGCLLKILGSLARRGFFEKSGCELGCDYRFTSVRTHTRNAWLALVAAQQSNPISPTKPRPEKNQTGQGTKKERQNVELFNGYGKRRHGADGRPDRAVCFPGDRVPGGYRA